MFCPFCGANIENNAVFCPSCGKNIGVSAFTNQVATGIDEGRPGGSVPNGDSYFDGTGGDLFVKQLLLTLLTLVTCSLATPWALVKVLEWRTSHTVIGGKRLAFNGTAVELFGMWIKWFLLSLVTCGLYSYYANVDYQKWVCRHTTYQGYELASGTPYNDSFFDGTFAEYIGTAIISAVISFFTCGIAYPWAACMMQNWKAKGTCIKGDRYTFNGTGGELFGVYIVNWLLTTVTCGIYSAWASCAIDKYIVSHTHIDPMRRG